MASLNTPGGIFESSEFSGFQDYFNFSVEKTSVGELFIVSQERNIQRSHIEKHNQAPN
jgi:hypothetical protein